MTMKQNALTPFFFAALLFASGLAAAGQNVSKSSTKFETSKQSSLKYKSSGYPNFSNYYLSAPALQNLPEGIVLDTKTSKVEVYPSGALIERLSTVSLQPGEHRLVIPGLPDAVQAHSLHISGFNEDAVAGSTFLESGTLVESRPPELVELEEAVNHLEGRESRLVGQEETLKQRRQLVLSNLSAIDKKMVSDTDHFRTLLNYGQKEFEDIDNELLKIRSERKGIGPKLDTLRKKYEELRAELQRPIKHVLVEVKVKKAVTLNLAIRYDISGPSWEPRHVARYDAARQTLSIETYAWVIQDTGESWKDVALRISTIAPARGLLPPAVFSKEISLEKQQQQTAGQADQLREVASQVVPMDGSDVRYFNINEKTTIQSGKRGKRILLKRISLSASDRRVAIPSINPKVYLELTVVNPDIVPILRGTTSLFNGTDYVGTAELPRVLPGESIVLPFGNDPEVTIERALVERTQSLKANKQIVNLKHRFSVQSRLTTPVTIEVQDRVPFSKDRRVKVDLQSKELPVVEAGKDDPAGLVRWSLKLAPAEKKSWEFTCTVTAPEEQRIIGLD
jgi:hypothetical protein